MYRPNALRSAPLLADPEKLSSAHTQDKLGGSGFSLIAVCVGVQQGRSVHSPGAAVALDSRPGVVSPSVRPEANVRW